MGKAAVKVHYKRQILLEGNFLNSKTALNTAEESDIRHSELGHCARDLDPSSCRSYAWNS